MRKRSTPLGIVAAGQVDDHGAIGMPCNGELKRPDFPLQAFPWRILVSLWGTVLMLLVIVPYLARIIPPTHRTDIKWWMTSAVYNIPVPDSGQEHYLKDFSQEKIDELRELGIKAVRLSDVFESTPDGAVLDYTLLNPAYGNMADFLFAVDVLTKNEMRLIMDVPVTYISTDHHWFTEEMQNRSPESTFIWKETNDVIKQEHAKRPLQALRRMQNLFHYWIQHGVSGFILLDYDRVTFTKSDISGINHIQLEPPRQACLHQLVDLTQTLKLYISEEEQLQKQGNDPDSVNDILLAVDITSTDDATRQVLYAAGADLVMHNGWVLSSSQVIWPSLKPFVLQRQVCDDPSTLSILVKTNVLNLINMVHLLLPGAAFVCDKQLPWKKGGNYVNAVKHYQTLVQWRLLSAMSWGEMQPGYIDRNIFSFVRYAFGKMYPRYIIIVNFGSVPRQQDFTMNHHGLTVPDSGIVRHFTCLDGNNYTIDSIIYLNNTNVGRWCGLLVELNLKVTW